jgi:hypothetical protein
MKVLSQSKSNNMYACDCNNKGVSKCKGCEDKNITVVKIKNIYKSQNKKNK